MLQRNRQLWNASHLSDTSALQSDQLVPCFYHPRLGDVQDNDNVFAAPYDNAAENVLLSQMDVCKIMIMQLKPLLTLLVRLKLAASNIKPHQVPLPPHSNRQLTSVNEIWKGMDWQSIFKLQFSDLW